jgi:hypothetical protein
VRQQGSWNLQIDTKEGGWIGIWKNDKVSEDEVSWGSVVCKPIEALLVKPSSLYIFATCSVIPVVVRWSLLQEQSSGSLAVLVTFDREGARRVWVL